MKVLYAPARQRVPSKAFEWSNGTYSLLLDSVVSLLLDTTLELDCCVTLEEDAALLLVMADEDPPSPFVLLDSGSSPE